MRSAATWANGRRGTPIFGARTGFIRFWSRMREQVYRTVILIALTALAGCETVRPFAIAGVYDLSSFAGMPLPGTIPSGGGGSMTVYAGELSLTTAGRFDLLVDRELCETPTECANEVVTETGTYDVTGDILLLIMDRGGSLDGRFRGDRITLNDSEPPSVWMRRQ